jgi:hypothetical protein
VAITVDEVEKLSEKQLKDRANACFRLAETRGVVERSGHISEAEFYMRELERRELQREWTLAAEDRVVEEKRHKQGRILELVVIALIAFELIVGVAGIWITIRESKAQDELTRNNLETLSDMNKAIQRQMAQLLPISVEIVCDDSELFAYNIAVDNIGRTEVELLGYRFENREPFFFQAHINWDPSISFKLMTRTFEIMQTLVEEPMTFGCKSFTEREMRSSRPRRTSDTMILNWGDTLNASRQRY